MPRIKFIRAMEKDLPAIMEQRKLIFVMIHFLEKDSFKKINSDLEIEEGCGNFDSKVLDCCLLRAELERIYRGEEQVKEIAMEKEESKWV